MIKILLISPVFFVMVLLTTAAQAAPLSVTVVDTLSFGLFTPGTNGGTVSFPADGNINGTGDVILPGGGQQGLVTIQANSGITVVVKVKKDKVTGPSSNATMNFTGNCIGPGGVLSTNECTFVATSGMDVVSIGAVLAVGANATQTGGHYSGTSTVTAKSRQGWL